MAITAHRVVISYRIAGQYAANVLGARLDTPSSGSSLSMSEEVAKTIAQWVLDEMVDFLPDDVEVTSVRASQLLPTTGNTFIRTFEPGEATGDYGAPTVAGQDAPCVILIPEVPGPKPGKIFLPGTPETGLDNGLYDSAWLAEVADSLPPFLIAGLPGVNDPMANVKGVYFADNPPISITIAYFYVSPIQGVQRRRLRPV